LKIVKVHLPKA